MPRAFGDDERVAAENDRDVMMPARIPSALVVIQPEFTLEVFIGALRSPALHDSSDDLLLGHAPRKRTEEVVGGLVLPVAPLDQEPERLALLDLVGMGVGVCGYDPTECEPGGERLLRSLSPSAPSEAAM